MLTPVMGLILLPPPPSYGDSLPTFSYLLLGWQIGVKVGFIIKLSTGPWLPQAKVARKSLSMFSDYPWICRTITVEEGEIKLSKTFNSHFHSSIFFRFEFEKTVRGGGGILKENNYQSVVK